MPKIMNIFTCFYTQPSCIHNTEVHSTCMISLLVFYAQNAPIFNYHENKKNIGIS